MSFVSRLRAKWHSRSNSHAPTDRSPSNVVPPWGLSAPLASPSELFEVGVDAAKRLKGSVERAFAGTVHEQTLATLTPPEISERVARDDAPIPSALDREGYFGESHAAYWMSGLLDAAMLSQLAPLQAGDQFLDLGCSTGRVLRHVDPDVHAFGVDINVNSIAWNRRYLPKVQSWLGTTLPHLPIPDRSVQVVSAFSVFTHIDEGEEAWLMELKRVIAPGGVALITYHPESTWDALKREGHFLRDYFLGCRQVVNGSERVTPAVLQNSMPGPRVVVRDTEKAVYNTNVFYSDSAIQARWSRYFDVEQIVPRAHGAHQNMLVLRQ